MTNESDKIVDLFKTDDRIIISFESGSKKIVHAKGTDSSASKFVDFDGSNMIGNNLIHIFTLDYNKKNERRNEDMNERKNDNKDNILEFKFYIVIFLLDNYTYETAKLINCSDGTMDGYIEIEES